MPRFAASTAPFQSPPVGVGGTCGALATSPHSVAHGRDFEFVAHRRPSLERSSARAERRVEIKVSLGCSAPEGAALLRPFALRRFCKQGGVSHGRDNSISQFSSPRASSQTNVVSSAPLAFRGRNRIGASGPSGACLQPLWPNPRSTGRPASGASLACRFPPACGLRSPVTSNVGRLDCLAA
jgi:hypothetical protein